jgi:hypothetical protein
MQPMGRSAATVENSRLGQKKGAHANRANTLAAGSYVPDPAHQGAVARYVVNLKASRHDHSIDCFLRKATSGLRGEFYTVGSHHAATAGRCHRALIHCAPVS